MADANNPTILFPQWAPDLSTVGTQVSPLVSGVLPQADGYGPFASLEELTQSLPGICRGYFFSRRSDGSIAVFAGTATRLYRLDNTTFAWVDVSKSGSAYSNLVAGANWQFAQFNDLVLAVQVGTAPQKYTLASDTGFVDLGGSPPAAGFVAVINRFVVLTGLQSHNRRVQWSDLDDPEQWTAGVGLSDFQDLPDGGTAHGISGGDAYGIVFQDECNRSFVYQPGSSTTFQITKFSENDPLYAQYSIVQAGDRTLYLSASGFKMITGVGGTPAPIGKERVDRTFFRDVDTGNLQLVIGAADPTGTRAFFAYKSKAGQAGLFDKVLCFDWGVSQAGQWTLLPLMGEYLAALAKPGLTLEQLDAIAPTPLSVTGAADNGSGAIRLTLNALSNSDFDIHGQNFIVVQGVVGTTEANGSWAFSIINSTHIDLIGSVFSNAYVSGGAIGGSLDKLPFSLDSVSTSAIAALSAVSSAHKIGFFNGDNIEAILETGDESATGQFIFITNVRPLTDSPDGLVSIGMRKRLQDAVTYSDETAIDADQGQCPQLVETRYPRGRLRIPADSVWTYARGLEPEVQLAGDS